MAKTAGELIGEIKPLIYGPSPALSSLGYIQLNSFINKAFRDRINQDLKWCGISTKTKDKRIN